MTKRPYTETYTTPETSVSRAWYAELIGPAIPDYARRADLRHDAAIGPAPEGWHRLDPVQCSRVIPHNEYNDNDPYEAGRNAEMNEDHYTESVVAR